MSTDSVETRVVQIQFDNQKFQKNIAKTQKSLEKLNKDMEFKGSKKELKELQKSIDAVNTDNLSKGFEGAGEAVTKFTVGLKEIIKYKVVGRVIDKMTDSAVKFMRTMSGIDNIRAGWAAYEEQITTIGGVVNNVLSKYDGDRTAALEDVTEAMEKLQWYADETSFSFQTMSNGIRQFTTSGLGVEAATQASMGVTALAGMSKEFDPNKISSAMNAVAKAFQTGNMNLMQWNTLTQTAGIVSEDFSAKLLEEAAAQGKLIKSRGGQYRTKKEGTLVTTENIADSLREDWLTKDILSNVMGEYSAASVAADKIISGYEEDTLDETVKNMIDKIMEEENWSELTASHMIEIMENEEYAKTLNELGYSFSKLSVQAFKSSQQATSATQAFQSVGIAIQAQFQHIFSSIWGNADESTEVWTKLANDLNTIIVSPFYTLSDIFSEWSRLTEGGSADFREAFGDLLDFAVTIRDIFNEVWNDVFGDSLENGVSILQKLTIKLKEFTKWLKTNETVQKAFRTVFTAVLNGIKIAGKIISSLFKLVKSFWPVVKVIIGAFGQLVKWLAEGIAKFANWVNESKIAEKIADNLRKALEFIVKWLIKIGEWFSTKWNNIKAAWESNGVAQKMVEFFDKLKKIFAGGDFKANVVGAIESFKNVMLSLWGTLKTVFPKLEEWYNKFVNSQFWQTVQPMLMAIWDVIKTFFGAIADTIIDFANSFKNDPSKNLWDLAKAMAAVVGVIMAIRALGRLGSVFKNLSWMFDAIRAYFRAKTFTMWVGIVVALAGSLWLLVDAVKKLSEVSDNGKLWSSAGVIMTLMAVVTLMMVALLGMAKSAGSNDFKIYKTITSMQRVCFGLAILFIAIAKMSETIKDIAWLDFLKVPALIVALAGCLAAVAAASKMSKEAKGTGLIKMAAIVGAMFGLVKLVLWSAEQFKEADWDLTWKVLGMVGAVVGAFLVAAIAITLLGRKLDAKGFLEVVAPLALIVGAIAAFAWFVNSTKDVNIDEFIDRCDTLMTAFLELTGMVAAILIVTKVATFLGGSNPMTVVKPISGIMTTIGTIVGGFLGLILALKVVEKLDIQKIKDNFGQVAILFAMVAGFVILLNIFSKTTSLNVGGNGASMSRNRNSPVFTTLLGVAAVMLALVACMKIVEKIEWDKYWDSFKKVGLIFGLVGVVCSIIGFSMKKVDAKAFSNMKWTILALVALIGALVALDWWLTDHPIKAKTIMMFIGLLVLLTASIRIASATFNKNSKSAIAPIIGIVVGITIILAALIVYGKVVQQVHWSTILNGVAILAVLFGGIIALLVILGKMLKQEKQGGIAGNKGALKSMKHIIVLFGIIVLMMAAIAVIVKMAAGTSWQQLLSIVLILGVVFGAVIALMVIVNKMQNVKISGMVALMLIVVAMCAILAVLGASAEGISKIDWKSFAIIMGVIVVAVTLLILVAAMAGALASVVVPGILIVALAMAILVGVFALIGVICDNYGDAISEFVNNIVDTFITGITRLVETFSRDDINWLMLPARAAAVLALLTALSAGLLVMSVGGLASKLVDFDKIADGLGKILPIIGSVNASEIKEAGKAIGIALSSLGAGLSNLNGNMFENFTSFLFPKKQTSNQKALDGVIRLFTALGNFKASAFTAAELFIRAIPDMMSSMVSANVSGLDRFTSALDDTIKKVRYLKEALANEIVLKLRLDDASLNAISNFRVNTSSAYGIQGAIGGNGAMSFGNVDNSSITVNVTNNNTYSDALAYSYDEQRQRAVTYEQVSRSISKK